MADAQYKGYALVCRAMYDQDTSLWTAYGTISWTVEGKQQFHHIQTPPQPSEMEALYLWKQMATLWIDGMM
jgi:hypothetical protein